MEQTYQVSASATKPATVQPPFPAHGLTATNNATVLVTVTSDQGDTFVLTPGQSKTQGYRGSPGQWTVTATSDGPGSVALTFTDQFTAGDATPQNVSQSADGNQYFQLTQDAITRTFDMSGIAEATLGVKIFAYPNGLLSLQLIIDNLLPTEIILPSIAVPAVASWFTYHFGRSSAGLIGKSLTVSSTTPGVWTLDCYLTLYGG